MRVNIIPKYTSRIQESLDPTKIFSYELNMTRSEIAQDVSDVLNMDIDESDSRLTDDFCESWIKLDIDFMRDMTDDDIRSKKMDYMISLLDKSDFEISEDLEKSSDDMTPDKVSIEDV